MRTCAPRLDVKGNDELAAIGSGFNHFVGNIQGVLLQVRGSADNVATASAEIAQGNNDLSARTEQQAWLAGRNRSQHGRTQLHREAKRRLRPATANQLATDALQRGGARGRCGRRRWWKP